MYLTRPLFFKAELETLNNFCPSRFSQVCSHFPFLQNANLYSKSRHTVQICVLEESENLDTLEKI